MQSANERQPRARGEEGEGGRGRGGGSVEVKCDLAYFGMGHAAVPGFVCLSKSCLPNVWINHR